MNANWEKALALVLKSEGGYVNNPRDPGGETNLGVTKKVWEAWVKKSVSSDDMKSLTPTMVAPLYKAQYWDAVFGDDLPNGVDYLVFDFAVNAGPHTSRKLLQRALGVKDDGVIGSITMDKVRKADAKDLINKFSIAKENYYKSLSTFSIFGKGWMNRVATVQKDALTFL